MDLEHKRLTLPILAAILSAALYFFGSGLHPLWFLTWLAPLPMLLIACQLSGRLAFWLSWLAYVAGSLNMWNYYRELTPLAIGVLATVGPSLVFASLVAIFRGYLLRGWLLVAMLSSPVLWVAFEYLQEFRSVHSTFGNLAYTQMDFPPILQIASVTGIWGIDFLLLLFPAAVAVLLLPGKSAGKRSAAITSGLIFILALGFGFYRLNKPDNAPRVTVGLIATDVPATLFPRSSATLELVKQYAAQIPGLAAKGAQVIIIPEKIGRIADPELNQADQILEEMARVHQITISASFEHLPNLNETRIYSPAGTLQTSYEKHHMLPAFESHLLIGTRRVILQQPSGKWGLQICKDMDFPLLSRQYANDGIGLMLVPAWDFVSDGWLHGRMAVLRGVESGFSIARAAKQGLLSVTDNRGRILAERSSGAAPFTSLVAAVPVLHEATIYARAGDWFAWLDLALIGAAAIAASVRRQVLTTRIPKPA